MICRYPTRLVRHWLPATLLTCVAFASTSTAGAQEGVLEKSLGLIGRYSATEDDSATSDHPRRLQSDAMTTGKADWGHWGADPARYSSWTSHSNRLIPIYTFGITLDSLRQQGSRYGREEDLRELYGTVPEGTLNPAAEYLDQTDVYRLQREAIDAGKNVILFVFDGMDWQTTRAAAIHAAGKVAYDEGRGTGLAMQDYRGTTTDYGFFVTSPYRGNADIDVDAQLVLDPAAPATGGYDPNFGGATPWAVPPSRDYLMGLDRNQRHTVTDSASSATSMTAGIKSYNAAINVASDGTQVEPVARLVQREHGYAVGVVSSVPLSHATPAAAYANNVSRNDYQDIARDLIGVRSVAHRGEPLPGLDVVIAAGWGEEKEKDAAQGANFVPGNRYVAMDDVARVSLDQGGKYVVAMRTPEQSGSEVLRAAADRAVEGRNRLLGFFGGPGGHLPYQTADGDYRPTLDVNGREKYTEADIHENPVLAEMAVQALRVLERDPEGFWLMVEAGDVDWANHANNLDNSIGAVLSGDAAFQAVVQWIEERDAWDETVVIVTADHGHYLNLTDPSALVPTDSDDL